MAKIKSRKNKPTISKHTHKTIDRVIRTPLKTGYELPTLIEIFKKVTKKNGPPNIFTITYRYIHEFTDLFLLFFLP